MFFRESNFITSYFQPFSAEDMIRYSWKGPSGSCISASSSSWAGFAAGGEGLGDDLALAGDTGGGRGEAETTFVFFLFFFG